MEAALALAAPGTAVFTDRSPVDFVGYTMAHWQDYGAPDHEAPPDDVGRYVNACHTAYDQLVDVTVFVEPNPALAYVDDPTKGKPDPEHLAGLGSSMRTALMSWMHPDALTMFLTPSVPLDDRVQVTLDTLDECLNAKP